MSNDEETKQAEGSRTKRRSTLDTEKHLENTAFRSSSSRRRRRRSSETFSKDVMEDDGDEFGGADEDEKANASFLGTLETEYEEEDETLPTLLRLTASQLQAKLPMALDNGKHEDIGGLMLRPDGLDEAVLASGGNYTGNNHRVDNDSDDSDDEFGDADDQDAPDPSYLQATLRDDDISLSPVRITSSQLQARIPAGLDKEQHEEISNLVGTQPSRESAKDLDKKMEDYEDDDDDTDNDDDDDDFLDADENDQAVQQYLEDYRYSLREQDDEMPVPMFVTPSQLQAHLPADLDNEKHDDIGNLLDSGHGNNITLVAKAASHRSEHIDGSKSEDQNEKKNENEEDNDEFGGADDDDAPVKQYLQDAKDRMMTEDKGSKAMCPVLVTTSQLEARIPAGLDKEKHEEISDLMDSRHEFDLLSDAILNDDDEFGDADENDAPVNRFLNHSRQSISFDNELLNGHDNNGDLDDFRYARIGGIDAEKHEGLTELVVVNSQHTNNDPRSDHQEEQEFGKANDSDKPVEQYLDRWKDSFNDDEDFDDIEYEELKGGPSRQTSSQNIDEEKHEDLGDLNKSERSQRLIISNDEDEFEQAGEFDGPVHRYLLAQNSMHGDDLLGEFSLEAQVAVDLDHETHDDLGGFFVSSGTSGDLAEFVSASTMDGPNSSFMKKQISIQEDEFLSHEEICQVENEVDGIQA